MQKQSNKAIAVKITGLIITVWGLFLACMHIKFNDETIIKLGRYSICIYRQFFAIHILISLFAGVICFCAGSIINVLDQIKTPLKNACGIQEIPSPQPVFRYNYNQSLNPNQYFINHSNSGKLNKTYTLLIYILIGTFIIIFGDIFGRLISGKNVLGEVWWEYLHQYLFCGIIAGSIMIFGGVILSIICDLNQVIRYVLFKNRPNCHMPYSNNPSNQNSSVNPYSASDFERRKTE